MQVDLRQVVLYVSDMARSIAFYRDLLELEAVRESAVWSELRAGSISLGLHLSAEGAVSRSGTNPPGSSELIFHVPNLDDACAELAEKGIPFDGPIELEDMGIRLANLRDPDGAAVVLQQAVPGAERRLRIVPFSQHDSEG